MQSIKEYKRYCAKEYKASLDCIEQNYENKKEKCQELFDVYKECKKEETRLRKLKNNGGRPAGFFPWQ